MLVTATTLLLTACASEPQYTVPQRTTADLYRECLATLPMQECDQLLAKWEMENRLNRLEMGQALILFNQSLGR